MSNEPQRRETANGAAFTPDLSLDVAFDILADGRRRAVLSYLLKGDDRADLEDLATHVTSVEPTGGAKRATATLHHLHLPKLADAGLINYDEDRKIATAQDLIRNLEPYLEWARQRN